MVHRCNSYRKPDMDLMKYVTIICFILTLEVIEMSSRILTDIGRKGRYTFYESAPSNYFRRSIDGYPGTYAFGYEVEDRKTGYNQFKSEQRYQNGTVVGSYEFFDSHGKPMHFQYVADEKGYRVRSVRRQLRY